MNESFNDHKTTPNELAQMMGPVYEKKALSADIQKEPGLVTLTAADGGEYCPVDQFLLSDDSYALRPELSNTWAAVRARDARRHQDALVTLVRMKTPREGLDGKSVWDVLTTEGENADLAAVEQAIYEDIV